MTLAIIILSLACAILLALLLLSIRSHRHTWKYMEEQEQCWQRCHSDWLEISTNERAELDALKARLKECGDNHPAGDCG